MFAGDTNLDEKDLLLHRNLNRWVAIKWRGDLFPPPKGVPYGTHIASFLHCEPGNQIHGVNVCWLIESSVGIFHRSCEPFQGIEATWLFRYDTLKQFSISELSGTDIDALRLSEFSATFSNSIDSTLQAFRSLSHLDQFRHPGFPDDVCAVYRQAPTLMGDLCQGEQVWVRISETRSDSEFRGILLNQPVSRLGTKGDSVRVVYISAANASVLVCCPL